ncbi:MAG: GHKL domain-containing protein [Treponema sp.]|nr:GHKL domain-containing protein [Treponema sp.]
MTGEAAWGLLLSLMAIFSTVNTVGALIICLPRRCSLPHIAGAFALFTALLLVLNFFTGYMARLPVSNSFMYLPLVLIMFKGHIFQILFSFFSQTFISLALTLLLIMLFGFLGLHGSVEYFILMLIAICFVFISYIVLVLRFGKPLLKKLFDGGKRAEWALYSAGAFVSHTALFVLWRIHEQDNIIHFGALLFLLWSFSILYYAIINTHDRARKQFEADYAREIIASGEGHYQKMNELFEKLRIMRHDYKYHQNVLLDFIQKGETAKAVEYLKGQQAEAMQQDLVHFCDNQVINALLVWYAGRYEKAQVNYTFKTALPEKLPVSDYDLCIVIGNLLENALEASLKLNDNRNAALGMLLHNEQLVLKLENNFRKTASAGGSAGVLPKSSDGRGLGLRSVQIVTERYKGKLFIKQDDTVFTVTVLINLGLQDAAV